MSDGEGGPGDVGRSSFPSRYVRFFQSRRRTGGNDAVGGNIGPMPFAPPQLRRGTGGDSYGAGTIGGPAAGPLQETASVQQVEAFPPKFPDDFPGAPSILRRLDPLEIGQIKRFYIASGTDLEEMVGFPFHGVRIDNLTPQWLYCAAAQQYVPPNYHGAQFQIFDASNKAWFKWQAPIGFTQPAAGAAGVTAVVYVTENILAPASGVDLSGLVSGSPDAKINIDQVAGTAVPTTGDNLDALAVVANGILRMLAENALFNGALSGNQVDRMRSASAANLANLSGLGAGLVTLPGGWSATSNPAAGTAASASRVAGGAGVRHICRSITLILSATTALGAITTVTVNVRDGASGAGTILETYQATLPASTLLPTLITIPDLNIVGSAATAMTVEGSAAIGNLMESITFRGYDAS